MKTETLEMVKIAGRRLDGEDLVERKRRRDLRRRAKRIIEGVVVWIAFVIYLWIVIDQAAKGIRP